MARPGRPAFLWWVFPSFIKGLAGGFAKFLPSRNIFPAFAGLSKDFTSSFRILHDVSDWTGM
jgi:hypothetical protein